ncbi:MAG: Smr/MutS family protein, partial [Bacteroidales bacterium]|nr:Smr/MutS family protein [Bacteroidales bacterium]
NFEHQLQQLELDQQEVARQRTELEVADNFLAEVTAKYQRLSDKLEGKKHDILSAARKEAQQILTDANRTVEQTISDIRTAQAEREATLQARQRLKDESERLQSAQEMHDAQMAKSDLSERTEWSDGSDVPDGTDAAPIAVGSIVRIDGQETYGEVVEMKGKKAVVESNSIRMTIALDRLTGTKKKKLPTDKLSQRNNRFQSIYDDINEKRKTFNPTLDLRGQRAEEALDNLQHFLDDAILLSEKELRILHGKGYGILKQIIREQLQANRDVRSFRSEAIELGGDGVTVVSLK